MTTSTSDHTANLGRETAAMHAYIIESGRAVEHPKGHTKKVLRYRTPCGIDVAVVKSLGAPSLYVARVVAEGRINHLSPEFMPAGRTGRILQPKCDGDLPRPRIGEVEDHDTRDRSCGIRCLRESLTLDVWRPPNGRGMRSRRSHKTPTDWAG